jgi:hypothetical protein
MALAIRPGLTPESSVSAVVEQMAQMSQLLEDERLKDGRIAP